MNSYPQEIPLEELIETITKKRLSIIREKANQARKTQRDKRLTAILSLVKVGPITNRNIREDLDISRATAANYLNYLVKQGNLIKIGRGRSVQYIFLKS